MSQNEPTDPESSGWISFEQGTTLGKVGSEEGIIIRDEEYEGARITLERDVRNIPFAITCGISGWMVHTTYAGTETEVESKYEEMKVALARMEDSIPYETDPNKQEKVERLLEQLDQFINRF